MLESLKKRPDRLRWPPRQRFLTTERGRTALEGYEDSIRALHQAGGSAREGLEQLQSSWAQDNQVAPQDAAVLGEFGAVEKGKLPREVVGALEDCGVTLDEVQAAVDRLYLAGLLAPAGGGAPLEPGANRSNES